MNKIARAIIVIPTGLLKTLFLKFFHPRKFKGVQFAQISPHTEITINGGRLEIGSGFKMRDGAKIRVRKGAILSIGKNVSVNSNDVIACHESITIGDNVELSPNVQIYDHDHDFRVEGGLKSKKYKTASVFIGNNTWIGANTVILRGSHIGKDVIIAAGSIVNCDIADGCVFVQKKVNSFTSHYEK